MNKDNAADFLPIVQALSEGKTIQVDTTGRGHWADFEEVNFVAEVKSSRFRVKPEPRFRYAVYNQATGEFVTSCRNLDAAKPWTQVDETRKTTYEVVKLVEEVK